MSREAMKLALEGAANYIDTLGGDSRKYRQALANEALDKMAENARELALDYEPAQPVVWHDAPQTIYLQVCSEADHCEVRFADHDEVTWCQDKIHDSDIAYVRASTTQQPPAQRTWVGLSEEDREQHRDDWHSNIHDKEFLSIEATLREKNGIKEQPAPTITPEHLLALAQTASLELDKVIKAFQMAAPVQQEPVGWITQARCLVDAREFTEAEAKLYGWAPLYTSPQPAQRTWVDPNNKTQKQYLPHIGEPVLFCHGGKTYTGKHTGGSFQSEVTNQYFNTWECRWMYLPAAHGIKENT